MRVYFLSSARAALKLDGQFLGTVDGFERYVEIKSGAAPFCELVPEGGYLPLAFRLDRSFFADPPPCVDIFRAGGEIYVYAREYAPMGGGIKIICQRRFSGALITIFSSGGVHLSIDGENFFLSPLPKEFGKPTLTEIFPCGKPALEMCAGEFLIIISATGKLIFKNRAKIENSGETLDICVPFETCADACAALSYSYDGDGLTLLKSVTKERVKPDERVLHFAFFEAALTRGQYEKYLCDELQKKAGEIFSYLGEFTGVCVPPSSFFERNPEKLAAGLIYPRAQNIFEVKIYAVELDGGKISNIYPVE